MHFSLHPASQPPTASSLMTIQFHSPMARKGSCSHPMGLCFLLFWGQKDFYSFFPSWHPKIHFLLFLLFLYLPLPLPVSLTSALNSSNFNLHSLLTEDLFLLARFSLSQPLDPDLIMNSSFWSFNLQIPLLWGITFLTPRSSLCHPATPFLRSSQLPSLTPLIR